MPNQLAELLKLLLAGGQTGGGRQVPQLTQVSPQQAAGPSVQQAGSPLPAPRAPRSREQLARLLQDWNPPMSPETQGVISRIEAEERAKIYRPPGVYSPHGSLPLDSGPGGVHRSPTPTFSTAEFAAPLPREGADRVAGLKKAFAILAAKRGAEPVASAEDAERLKERAERLKEEYAGRRAGRGYTAEEVGKQAKTALERTQERARRQSQVHQFAANRAMTRKMRLGQPVTIPGMGGGQGGMAQMFLSSGDPKLIAAGMEMLQRQQQTQLGREELAQQGRQFGQTFGLHERRAGADERQRQYAHEQTMGELRRQGRIEEKEDERYEQGQRKEAENAWQNVYNARKLAGWSESEARAAADEAAGRMDLPKGDLPVVNKEDESPKSTPEQQWRDIPKPPDDFLTNPETQKARLETAARIFKTDPAAAMRKFKQEGGTETMLRNLLYDADPSQWSSAGRFFSPGTPETRTPLMTALRWPTGLGLLDVGGRMGQAGERAHQTSSRQALAAFIKRMLPQ